VTDTFSFTFGRRVQKDLALPDGKLTKREVCDEAVMMGWQLALQET
jgi:hypothetical protein